MLHRVLSLPVVLLLCSTPSAQRDLSARLRPITAPVREVSVRLDRATGRAVREPAALGGTSKQVVFDNTCPSGYYVALRSSAASGGSQAEAIVDQGRVPSTASAFTSLCTPGSADAYSITRLQITYCTTTGVPVDYVTHSWNGHGAACPNDFGIAPDASFTVLGLPRSRASGAVACYQVTIDLGTPGFTLDGGATNTTAERFGWSMQYPGTTGGDGPKLSGNPNVGGCPPCVGTIWERPSPTTDPGTGLGVADAFWLETFGTTFTGCYFFDSPFAAFYLRLDADEPGDPWSFCDGFDGAHALCPCGATDPYAGCDKAQGAGVRLDLVAQTFAPNSATLTGTGIPVAAVPVAIVIRGNDQEPVPVPFYDGLRCVGLTGFTRFAPAFGSGGVSTHYVGHGVGGGTYSYQLWYRNFPISYCVTTGPGMGAANTSNGRVLVW